jgi:transcription elongation factor SPT4
MADLSGAAAAPTDFKHLVACVACRLVKTAPQFEDTGCENCAFLEMAGDPDRVADATTHDFRGVMALVDPAGSWAARWVRLRSGVSGGGSGGGPVPGVYAVALGPNVQLSASVEEAIKAAGIRWVRGTE